MKPDEEVYRILSILQPRHQKVAGMFLPEPHRTETLEQQLNEAVRNGWYIDSLTIARRLGRELSAEELWQISRAGSGQTSGNNAAPAKSASQYPITPEEIDELVRILISGKLFHLVPTIITMHPQHFQDPGRLMNIITSLLELGAGMHALSAVNELPEPQRYDALIDILKRAYLLNNRELMCGVADRLIALYDVRI